MSEDLLTRIQCELNERLRELRSAVDEHDRLVVDLKALPALSEPPPVVVATVTGPASPVVLGSRDLPNSPVLPKSSPANVMRSPAVRALSRTRTVSPKVARLMRAPRRASLERSDVHRACVGANFSVEDDLAGGIDLFPGADPHLGLDEVDVEAEVYERSL
jgi:hypothetical protein